MALSAAGGIRPGGSDRVVLIWGDHAVENRWLEVSMRATANTGLTEADVFDFRNAVGETGNSAVDAVDTLLARSHQTWGMTALELIDLSGAKGVGWDEVPP